MKKLISLICLTISFTYLAQSQSISENKVKFNYIQLPTNVIAKQYTFYNVEITRSFEQANDDSLLNYQTELESASLIFEAEMVYWKQQVKAIDRTYLAQMGNWEKATYTDENIPIPKKSDYPNQPIIKTVDEPLLHGDILDHEIKNIIDLKGFKKSAGGAVVTVDIFPVSGIRIIETKKGSGTSTKYQYTCNYSLPIGLKVVVPGQGIVLQTIIANNESKYSMKSHSSKYDHALWLLDNKDQFLRDLEKHARTKALEELNKKLNDKCGFPVKSKIAEVYSVKKFKDFEYSDITNAYTIASQGYKKIGDTRDRKNANAKLVEAINEWKKILEESTPNDSKSRINDKVTAMLHCNIAEAYIWISEFDEAEKYINLTLSDGIAKFKRKAKILETLLKERKLRWNAYLG